MFINGIKCDLLVVCTKQAEEFVISVVGSKFRPRKYDLA